MPMCLDYRKIIIPALTVLWMSVIFWFSSAPAEESSNMSLSAGRAAARVFIPDFDEWSLEEQDAFAERIDHPVRKTAHAGEYAVLGMLMLGTVNSFSAGAFVRKGMAAWLLTALYAATDEFHQLFVAGRSGQISDVLLDSTGAAAGILLYIATGYLARIAVRFLRRSRERNQ